MLRRNSDDWTAIALVKLGGDDVNLATYLETSFKLSCLAERRLHVIVFREIVEVGHSLIGMTRMRRSAADHGKKRGRCRTRRRHLVDVGDLDRLVWRGSGCRRGPAVVTMLGRGQNERKVLIIFVDVAAATLRLPALRPAILVLGSLGSVDVVGVQLLVLLLLLLRQLFPVLPLLSGQALPLLADGLGEISLTLLLGRHVRRRFLLSRLAVFATLAAEKDESILGSLDVVLVSLLWPTLDVATRGRRLSTFM